DRDARRAQQQAENQQRQGYPPDRMHRSHTAPHGVPTSLTPTKCRVSVGRTETFVGSLLRSFPDEKVFGGQLDAPTCHTCPRGPRCGVPVPASTTALVANRNR